MKQITVNVSFTGAVGGLASVVILGPGHNYNYSVDGKNGADIRTFSVNSGLNDIKVVGMTGGTCVVTVKGNVADPVNNSCKGPNVYIDQTFIVQ